MAPQRAEVLLMAWLQWAAMACAPMGGDPMGDAFGGGAPDGW